VLRESSYFLFFFFLGYSNPYFWQSKFVHDPKTVCENLQGFSLFEYSRSFATYMAWSFSCCFLRKRAFCWSSEL
jgi:hypothetical protein